MDTKNTRTGDTDVAAMALYKLGRIHKAMNALADKPTWTLEDTASFTCMHYLGDDAVEHGATQLQLIPGEHAQILDLGSGYGHTGRYLATKYRAKVVGVEMQTPIHELAQKITARSGLQERVHSINSDFMRLDTVPGEPFSHVVSYLCILHIPLAHRAPLFSKTFALLLPGGRTYIEDYYLRAPLNERTAANLKEVISIPFLPTKAQYIKQLTAAGFTDVQFEDVTPEWTDFVTARAKKECAVPDIDPSLAHFYNVVKDVFKSGQVGGVRITCVRP